MRNMQDSIQQTISAELQNGFRCAVGEELYEAGKIEEAIEEEI